MTVKKYNGPNIYIDDNQIEYTYLSFGNEVDVPVLLKISQHNTIHGFVNGLYRSYNIMSRSYL